jgi:hypothetical protein
MFRLAKIQNGRTNESEARVVDVSALSAAIGAGTPVNILAGVVTPIGSGTTLRATHMVEHAATKGATRLLISDLLPGMVYEAPMTAAPGSIAVGGEYQISASGMTATAVSGSVRGAVLYDRAGATAAGDRVYVTFPVA